MKILDQEGEIIVNLTDVKNEEELQSLLNNEDPNLTDIMFDSPLFAVSLKEYEEAYGEGDFEGMEEKTCTYEEWMQDWRECAQNCLEE